MPRARRWRARGFRGRLVFRWAATRRVARLPLPRLRLSHAAGRSRRWPRRTHTRPRSWSCASARRRRPAVSSAIRQRWVPYTQIANNLRRAVLVAEDSAFFDHDGIDLKELRASLEANWEEGRFTRGASTITQQLAKNLYLSPSRNPDPQAEGAVDHAPARGGADQAPHSRDLPQRHRVGRRHLRRRGGVARLLRQAGLGADGR